jgi:MFS transporter, DHA1 family, tetracycline resistance protein
MIVAGMRLSQLLPIKWFHNVIMTLKTYGDMATIQGIVFINLVGFGLLVPLLPFFAKTLTADPWQVTFLFSAYSAGQFISEPILGKWSDRIGRKPILIMTTFMTMLGYISLAFAPHIGWAVAVRFFSGLCAGNISTIQGYVADVSTPENKAHRLASIGVAFSLGFVVGPFLGSLLTTPGGGHDGYMVPLFFAASMSGFACLGSFLFLREKRPNDLVRSPPLPLSQIISLALQSKIIAPILLTTAAYTIAFSGLESIFALWSHARYGWSEKEVGLMFLVIGITAASMQLTLLRPLIRRFGEFKVLGLGMMLFGLSFWLQCLNHIPALILVIVIVGTVGQSFIFSTISAILSHSAHPDRQGAMLGLNMSVSALSRIVGPMVAGALFSWAGPDYPVLLGGVFCIPAAGLAIWAEKEAKRLKLTTGQKA